MTKCDEIFDLLVADGQILVPQGMKLSPLEQRNKRGFCKYHNFLGHKTSQYFLFIDLIQTSLKDGCLKFIERSKAPMKIDYSPLQVEEDHYTIVVEVNMVEITDYMEEETDESCSNKMGVVYPRQDDGLINYLYHCKSRDSKVMLCPRCSCVFDKKVAKEVEKARQEHLRARQKNGKA